MTWGLDEVAARLYSTLVRHVELVTDDHIRDLIKTAAQEMPGDKFSQHFLQTEWADVVDAWQLKT